MTATDGVACGGKRRISALEVGRMFVFRVVLWIYMHLPKFAGTEAYYMFKIKYWEG